MSFLWCLTISFLTKSTDSLANKLAMPSFFSAMSTMKFTWLASHFAHLKLSLRCSNGEFKKESESRVDHQAGILNTEDYEFLFSPEVSSKLTANATVVSCGVSVAKCEVFNSQRCSSPKFANMSVPSQTLRGCSVVPDPSCRRALWACPQCL